MQKQKTKTMLYIPIAFLFLFFVLSYPIILFFFFFPFIDFILGVGVVENETNEIEKGVRKKEGRRKGNKGRVRRVRRERERSKKENDFHFLLLLLYWESFSRSFSMVSRMRFKSPLNCWIRRRFSSELGNPIDCS